MLNRDCAMCVWYHCMTEARQLTQNRTSNWKQLPKQEPTPNLQQRSWKQVVLGRPVFNLWPKNECLQYVNLMFYSVNHGNYRIIKTRLSMKLKPAVIDYCDGQGNASAKDLKYRRCSVTHNKCFVFLTKIFANLSVPFFFFLNTKFFRSFRLLQMRGNEPGYKLSMELICKSIWLIWGVVGVKRREFQSACVYQAFPLPATWNSSFAIWRC